MTRLIVRGMILLALTAAAFLAVAVICLSGVLMGEALARVMLEAVR